MSPSRPAAPSTVADVLATLLAEPGRPRITWYGDDGERVELSGAVLVNWVTKTTNLLVEELDAAPGSVVLLDLPPHWRSIVWALAVWQAGACVVPGDDAGGPAADVVVTSRPLEHRAHTDVVAVALPALARAYPDDLPPGALDAAASVMTYADTLGATPATVPGAPALTGADPARVVTHGDLLTTAASHLLDHLTPAGTSGASGTAGRLLTSASRSLRDVLLTALATWAQDGSVVLVVAQVLSDEARTARVVADERVTQRLP